MKYNEERMLSILNIHHFQKFHPRVIIAFLKTKNKDITPRHLKKMTNTLFDTCCFLQFEIKIKKPIRPTMLQDTNQTPILICVLQNGESGIKYEGPTQSRSKRTPHFFTKFNDDSLTISLN